MIKWIAMDLDGTLTNDDKVITEETKKVLMKAQKKGYKLILASGRPITGMVDLAKELKMNQYHGILVSYNGSLVTDCTTNEVLFEQALSVEESKKILEHMKQFDVQPMIDKDQYMYVNDVYGYKVEYEARGGNYLLCEQEDLAEFCDFKLNKILVAGEAEYLNRHYKEMAAPFEGKVNSMFTAPFYYEYNALGIDKTKAIQEVMNEKGESGEHIIAFGDAQNDATMIAYAKIGVAMGNAIDELKESADYITDTNNNDGIAKALKHFLPDLV